jgi:hypothetical protein
LGARGALAGHERAHRITSLVLLQPLIGGAWRRQFQYTTKTCFSDRFSPERCICEQNQQFGERNLSVITVKVTKTILFYRAKDD